MRDEKIRKIVIAALLAALTCVATMIIKIPTPTDGYINLGDVLVLYSAYILGPVWGALAAGIGSAMADVISGYMTYAPATLIIKAAVAVAAALLARAIPMGFKAKSVKFFICGIISELIMVFGYLLFEALFLGQGAAAIVGVPMNIIQAGAGVILSSVIMNIKPLADINRK